MSARKKGLILAAVAFVAAIIVAVVIYVSTRPATAEGSKTFTVEVVHADGTAKTFTYHTDEEYLGPVLLAEGLIAGVDSQYGLYIITVDSEDAVFEDDRAYWALYEGDEYAMQGIDTTPVLDGSAFSLVYTIG